MSRRTRSRASRSRTLVGGAALVVLALVVPVTANAVTSPFSDVPTSHPFFDEILWMSNTGVTTGFPDGTFRPAQPVTRQAMSAFMQRLYDVQEEMEWRTGSTVFSGFNNTDWVDIPGTQATVSIPDGVYGQFTARFSGESLCSGVPGEWCSLRIVRSKDGGPFQEMFPVVGDDFAFDHGDGNGTWESHMVERIAFGDPGADYTVKVQGLQVSGADNFSVDDWTFVVETDLQKSDYIPF